MNIEAASWIEGELRTALEVVALRAPGDLFEFLISHFQRIDADACGSVLVERLHEAVKALFAHYQPRLTDEILGQLHNLHAKLRKIKEKLLSLQLIYDLLRQTNK